MSSVASAAPSKLDSTWVFHPVTELVSAIVSFVAYVGLLGWRAGTATFLIVLVHELGHWLAHKHYGIPTRGILFLVVLAATPFSPSKKHTSYQDAMVSLAGPLTGIPVGIICLLLYIWTGDVGYAIGVYIAVTLNVSNLIPIGSLDGGWVLNNMRPTMDRNRTHFLAFCMMAGAAVLITVMWSFSFGLIMAAFFTYKLTTSTAENPRVKCRRVMSDMQFHRVQALYMGAIFAMMLIATLVDADGSISKAYVGMVSQQLSTVWHTLWG